MNISINNSIKRFLLFYITLFIVIIYGLISVVSYNISQDELGELYDANLQQVAEVIATRNLATLSPKPLDISNPAKEETANKEITSEEEFYVRVLNKQGQILYVSHPAAVMPTPSSLGFSDHRLASRKWRFYTTQSGNETIQVAQSLNLRKSTIKETALNLMSSQLLFLPVLVVIVFIAIRKALDPLAHLSEVIKNRQSTELAPFTLTKMPTEVRPLVDALNMFMGKVSDMVGVMKRFTSDAAHELRTPITALKLQLAIIEQAKTPNERDQAIDQFRKGINRAEQLVSQLLTLARIEPDHQTKTLVSIDLSSLTKDSIEELLPLALAKRIDLGLNTSLIPLITGVRNEVKIMINNIIDNAIRYTPEHGKIDISIYAHDRQITLEVSDTGPGIADEDKAYVFERFYRGKNKDTVGSGLGLSIVKEIADRHHAKIETINLNSGLCFKIHFLKEVA